MPMRSGSTRSGGSSSQPPLLPTTNTTITSNSNGNNTGKPPNGRNNSTTIPRKPAPPARTKSSLRRPALKRAPTHQTQYVDLLVRLDEIPRWHNMLAAFATWILLAGYLVFPATFTKVQDKVETDTSSKNGNDVVTVVVASAVRNVGLLWVAGVCCVIGGAAIGWLWVRWWWHYIWLLNRVFLPCTTNSIAGLISTLVNIYSAQDGKMNVTAKVTLGVTASCSAVFALLFVVHQLLLMRVKKKHQRVIDADEKREKARNGGNALETLKHKAQEPAAMPGGVV